MAHTSSNLSTQSDYPPAPSNVPPAPATPHQRFSIANRPLFLSNLDDCKTYLQHSLPPTRRRPLRQGVPQDKVPRHTRQALHRIGAWHAGMLKADEIADGNVAAVAVAAADDNVVTLYGEGGQHGGAMCKGAIADVGDEEVAEAEELAKEEASLPPPEGSEDAEDDDFVARNGRRQTSYTTDSPDRQTHSSSSRRRPVKSVTAPTDETFCGQPHEHGGMQTSNPYYVDTKIANQHVDPNQEVANEAAAALFKTPINTPGDALHLLLEASGRTESLQRQDSNPQGPQLLPPSANSRFAQSDRLTRTAPSASLGRRGENIDPAITGNGDPQDQVKSPDVTTATKAWSRLRFVRAGWFTAGEAMSYIDYYYEYLVPLTPISPPDFRSPATHASFLNDEPLLVVTVLTIASRYMQLDGPGAKSRSYMVHERLWSYLQNMITRMFWGQEQFGGGFCGAGTRRPKPTVKGGLRTLGTIESLLLLSEFHPRSMHFPPGDDGDDILTTTDDDRTSLPRTKSAQDLPSFGETAVAGWSEPALRSDRMSWSLIGMSYTLAFELGVFGNFQNGIRSPPRTNAGSDGSLPLSIHEQRADRIERLLYVYINSAAGRFGIPTMYSRQDEDLNPRCLQARVMTASDAQDSVDLIQECWLEMTMIMKACNTSLFPSRDYAQAMIESGEYVALLEQFQPLMNSYGEKLRVSNIPRYPRIILSIEIEYVKLYVYSLALQAVLGHWTTNAASVNGEQTSSVTFSTIYRRNGFYIREVVEAARSVLRLVVDGLLPGDYLKHAPVRTHFRILSGAMFLLKTFALGATEDEVSISLQLLDRTVKALRTSVVDDVHLSLRIADLLEGITSSIRHKFVRLPARASNSNRPTPPPRSAYGSPMRATLADSTDTIHAPPQSHQQQQYQNERANSLSGVPTNAINPFDTNNNISIMPPPNSGYLLNNADFFYTGNNTSPSTFDSSNNMEEDWLTLDLNPLLSSSDNNAGASGFQAGVGNDAQWFGNFGPEINGNLEVLGKLVEGWETTGLTTGFQ
ncbi:MAG: hypothetical protein Q9210_000437 [Variospora velana]